MSDKFQSTPPRGWRPTEGVQDYDNLKLFQSTPPRGWRRKYLRYGTYIKDISIHSTARVETLSAIWRNRTSPSFQSTPPRGWRLLLSFPGLQLIHISIHSTARVETLHFRRKGGEGIDFNPLHREGGDRIFNVSSRDFMISIHSTARVETTYFPIWLMGRRFQSTPPRGWRQKYAPCQDAPGIFQSTPPRGWRRLCQY